MDAWPMIEACMLLQKPGHTIGDLVEGYNNYNLMLNNGDRTAYIMTIKWHTDEMLEHAKRMMDQKESDANA